MNIPHACAVRIKSIFQWLLLAALWLAAPALAWSAETSAARVATFDATHLSVPADLGSTWLIHAGDDPAFARPDFDDSQWTAFDPYDSIATLFPGAHPEIVWYRQRVKVDPAQLGLALREDSIASAFEIYVNGERVISTGLVAPYHAYTYTAKIVKRIPDRAMQTGQLTIALRVRLANHDWRAENHPGFYPTNLTIGQESTLKNQDWLTILGENFSRWLDLVLVVAIGLVALVLFAGQRRQIEYLWVFAFSMIQLLESPVELIMLFRNIPVVWRFVTATAYIATPLVWVTVFFAFVGKKIGWRFRAFLICAGILNAYSNLGNLLPSLPGRYALLENLPFVASLAIVVPIMLAIQFRRGNREAGILLVPVLLFSLYLYLKFALILLFPIPAWRDFALAGINLIDRFPAGPFVLSLNQISGILSTLALAVIMLMRATRISHQQAVLEGELAAAREVQQVILPEQIEEIPGFLVESAYEPAQQVGGDFFQVLPGDDGGLLLVLGDVAGKGLPAAMLVSVLVGAIRTAAEYTSRPEEILAQLNERLIGRARGGFSTALAVHISAKGEVALANAGHLSPYLDGREIDLPGALPLGILSGARYESSHFFLPPGSRLTFYSDGVVEAQNPKGELFGFDRGRELSIKPAAEIVQLAKEFGQSDDITVVAVMRQAAVAAAA